MRMVHQKRYASLLLSCCLLTCLAVGCESKVSPPPPIPVVSTNDETVDTEARDAGSGSSNENATSQSSFRPSGAVLSIARRATVRLSNDDFDGSGVIIAHRDSEVFVLTVAHAARETITHVEFFSDGDRPIFVAHNPKVLSRNDRADLALLKMAVPSDASVHPVKISKPSKEDPSERPKERKLDVQAVSVGCGSGRTPEPLSERIIAEGTYQIPLGDKRVSRYMWKTKSAQEVGRSGGPLLDVKGSLLGVALGKHEGQGFYAHIREISDYLIDTDLDGLLLWADVSR